MQDEKAAAILKLVIKELQLVHEKDRILKASKAERASGRLVESEKKAIQKELQDVISNQQHQPNLQTGVPQTQELAIEIDSLKKHIISIELKWEEEKGRILGALNAERTLRREAQATITVIEKKLQEDTIALKKEVMDTQKDLEFTKRQLSAVSRPAESTQDRRHKKLLKTEAFLKKRVDHLVLAHSNLITITSSEQKALEEKNKETESKLKQKESQILQCESSYKKKVNDQEEHVKVLAQEIADLKVSNLNFKELSEKTADQRVRELAYLIAEISSERTALKKDKEETKSVLQEKESEILQSQAEYKENLTAMEARMAGELASKDGKCVELEEHVKVLAQGIADLQVSNLHFKELSQKTEEQRVEELTHIITEISSERTALKKNNEEYKKKLAAKDTKVIELEEEIADLQVSKLHFQELSEKTDKQKAQMRKDAEKAKKAEQKRLAKEKEEIEKKRKEIEERERRFQLRRNQGHLNAALRRVLC